ncbi:MAG TPA: 7-carboxy-7-deazaguanine synthase QueE [Candidatus Tenderia sp.]|nr:7-carboxy-7-deazaguanine synthase QueE [Candidatus Tenderia sp.]
MTQGRLRITEIFYSLQGEARTVGLPTVFVRLTGCPLRCQYCDTRYAFQGGEAMDIAAVLEQVSRYDTRYVCVTGGEPLSQAACIDLLQALCDVGYDVSLETSGALDVSNIDARVSKVMDLKTPASGEQQRNLFENIDFLSINDQVKFVICDRNDYQWAKEIIIRYELVNCCEVLMSPSFGQLEAKVLAEWVLEDRLPVRFQLQQHKLLWQDEPGR